MYKPQPLPFLGVTAAVRASTANVRGRRWRRCGLTGIRRCVRVMIGHGAEPAAQGQSLGLERSGRGGAARSGKGSRYWSPARDQTSALGFVVGPIPRAETTHASVSFGHITGALLAKMCSPVRCHYVRRAGALSCSFLPPCLYLQEQSWNERRPITGHSRSGCF